MSSALRVQVQIIKSELTRAHEQRRRLAMLAVFGLPVGWVVR